MNVYSNMDSAIKENDRSTIERLLERGADINAQNVHGMTPLHISILWKVPEITLFLLERGADVSKRDRAGETPLHLAANRGMIPVIDALIQKGADVYALDAAGKSPVEYARNANIRSHLRSIKSRQSARESGRILTARLPDVIRSQKANQQGLPVGQVRVSKEWTEGIHGQPKKELPSNVIRSIGEFITDRKRGGRKTRRRKKIPFNKNG